MYNSLYINSLLCSLLLYCTDSTIIMKEFVVGFGFKNKSEKVFISIAV